MVGAGRRRSAAWQCYKVIPQGGPGIQFDLWAGAGPLVTTWYYLDTLMWIQGATWTHWCESRELPGHTDLPGHTSQHSQDLTSCSVLMFLPCLCHSDPPGLSLSPGLPPPLCLHPPPRHPAPTPHLHVSSCVMGICKPECCQVKPLCAKHAANVKFKCIWSGRMELLIWACFSFLYLCHMISTKRLTMKRKWIQWECNNENETHFVHIQCTCVCFSFLYLHHIPKG